MGCWLMSRYPRSIDELSPQAALDAASEVMSRKILSDLLLLQSIVKRWYDTGLLTEEQKSELLTAFLGQSQC